MDISLKRAHFYCLLLLSHYLCAPAVGFRGGLLTVSVPQQYLVSFMYIIHILQKDYKQVV